MNYPIAKSATYTPHSALLPDLLANAANLNVPNLVFVQVSTYGHDNSCQLDAVSSVGLDRGRAVVEFDPDTIDASTLQKWHEQGVRGVRINLKSVGRDLPAEELQALITKYAKAIQAVKTWAIDLHISMSSIPALEPLLPVLADSSTNLIIDHLGSPPGLKRDMSSVPGWTSLLYLMRHHDNFHVKVSAPYRFSRDRQFNSCEHVVRPLLEARQGRGVLWASDWPHTRFETTEIEPWVERCLEWCDGDQGVVDMLFRENAREVWDVV